MGKIYLRIFVETLAQDLPGNSVAKKECLGVLLPFSSYAVFGKTFGPAHGGASMPAADDDENNTRMEDGRGEEVQDTFTKMKESTAGVAVKLFEFLFDLFGMCLDDNLAKFLTNDAKRDPSRVPGQVGGVAAT